MDGNKVCGKAHFYIAEGLEKTAEPILDDMKNRKFYLCQ